MQKLTKLRYSPIFDGSEGLDVCEVKHENEPHSSAVVSCCDGMILLLASRVPNLKLDALVIPGEREETGELPTPIDFL